MERQKMRMGFTLIEIALSIGLIVVITAIYFVAANPAGQLAASRNNKRKSDLQTIMLAVRENIASQGNEQFACAAGNIPTSTSRMKSGGGGYDIASCLIPSYGLFALPFDPSATSSHYASTSDYDTGYSIMMNASSGAITLSAPYAELGKSITFIQ